MRVGDAMAWSQGTSEPRRQTRRFASERCLFERNFPADTIAGDYRTIWNAFKIIAAACSADEKAKMLAGNAARICRIDAGA
jgi:predicted TIM-barrel fold metal-dependent hydrolase